MLSYNGPKTINDTNGVPRPYEGYVKWLEERHAELEAQSQRATAMIRSLQGQVSTYSYEQTRRAWFESDYVQQHDDGEDQ